MDLLETRKNLMNNGIAAAPYLVSIDLARILQSKIFEQIKNCSAEIGCLTSEYLYSTSRWAHPSPITRSVLPHIKTIIQEFIENLIGESVNLIKINVICKSAYAKRAIPCHQDAAYATDDTSYEFSMWLALNDVPIGAGQLEFLPGSHLDKIYPAVDFWQPNFIDEAYQRYSWKKRSITIPIQAGDGILFDSKIWHRSAENYYGQDRYAIVTRWKRNNAKKILYPIPPRISDGFGMWTCGDITIQLLQKGLAFGYKQQIIADLSQLIQKWQDILKNNKPLPFACDAHSAAKALKALWILHKTSVLHNGGDAQGIIYPQLWHTFLCPLSNWLAQFHD